MANRLSITPGGELKVGFALFVHKTRLAPGRELSSKARSIARPPTIIGVRHVRSCSENSMCVWRTRSLEEETTLYRPLPRPSAVAPLWFGIRLLTGVMLISKSPGLNVL
jgi:hypothetical protein